MNLSDQPVSSRKVNRSEFGRIMQNMKFRKKADSAEGAGPYLPLDMGLFLTGRCNLRCRHCFEWNEDGFLTNGSSLCANSELSVEKIAECLAYTRPAGTRLYLWGGEPLMYSRFHELCALLQQDPRWTTVCTNGLLVGDHLEDLTAISDHLVLLISLDGFRECNDAIRGRGTFDRVIGNIRMLRELSRRGEFRGEVSVCCVLSDAMTTRLYDYCEFMEELDINTLYLSFPWYISPDTARRMDAEFERRFGDLIRIEDVSRASWHDFTYHLSPDRAEALKKELRRIAGRRWRIRVRFQPALEPEEIDDFIRGGSLTAQGRTKCLAPFNRIDILQDGEVSACKLFREFSAGNLNRESLQSIWEGEKMAAIRSRLQCGLMPACSKCVLLYLNGA